MDDYEHTNALEWDVNARASSSNQQSGNTWQVVGSKKQKAKQQQPPSQRAPSTASQQPVQHTNTGKSRNRAKRGKGNASSNNEQQTQRQPAPPQAFAQLSEISPLSMSSQPALHPAATSPAMQPQEIQRQPPARNRQQASPQQRRRALEQNVKQKGKPKDRLKIKMTQGADNLGERLWRKHEPPLDQIRIPFVHVADDGGHLEIAKRHRTFLWWDQDNSGPRGSKTFGIWGAADAVADTKQDIIKWIHDCDAGHQAFNKVDKFAKIVSLTDNLRIRAEKEWEKEVKRHRYRQRPPVGRTFQTVGYFYWPNEHYRPDEILGPSYEALDPIRMQCSCYILHEDGMFQVMGKTEGVQNALDRLRKTLFQIRAREIASVELYLLDSAAEIPARVVLREYKQPHVLLSDDNREGRVLYSPRADEVSGYYDQHQRTAELEVIRRSVILTVKKLHYYRGSVQLRIRLGTFIATRYIAASNGTYDIESFRAMINDSRFHGQVTRELGSSSVERRALNKLQDAADFLHPRDHDVSSLSDVKPVYTAIFTFSDSVNAEAGDIRLTMTFKEVQDADSPLPSYEITSKKWTRMDCDTGAPNSLVDISLNDLNTGMTWQFEIHAAQGIEDARLPAGLASFPDRVKVDSRAAHSPVLSVVADMSFIKPISHPQLKHMEERIRYHYYIAGSDYTLELTRFQHRDIPPRRSLAVPAGEHTVYEARWGVSVYRNEWDAMFTRNEQLSVGERAEWSHEEGMWFPTDDPMSDEQAGKGFEQMMEKLKRVAGLVLNEDDGDLIGGMTVG